MALNMIIFYLFFNGFLVTFGKILHRWSMLCISLDAQPGIQILNELYCAVLEGKKQKAEKTLPWHSGAAFRSFLGPISRNPFSDWNKRTKWQLVIDLVASSPRQKYLVLIMYKMLYVICTAFYYLHTLFTFSLSILCLHTYLPTYLTTEKGSM